MIEQLTLSNFKKHQHLDLELDSGVTSITGPNAAGKSSLLKGILFALFGSAAAGAKDHLWNWDSDGSRSVGLAVTLPEHGRVILTRSPSGAKATTEDGRVLASGNTAVTKFVEESMGMLAKDLRTLLYSPQGEAQGILSMGPAALQNKVESLAKLDDIDKVLSMINDDVNRLDGLIDGLSDVDTAMLQSEIDKLNTFLDYNRKEFTATENMLRVLGETHATTLKAYQAGEVLNQKHASLAAQLNQIDRDIINADANRKAARIKLAGMTAAAPYGNVDEFDARVHQLNALYLDLDMRIKQEKSRLQEVAGLQKSIEELKGRVSANDSASAQIAELEKVVEPLTAQTTTAKSEMDAAVSKYLQLSGMLHSAVCPTCKRAMEGVDLSTLEADIAEAKANQESTMDRHAGVSSQLQVLQSHLQGLRSGLDPRASSDLIEKQNKLASLTIVEPEDTTTLTAQQSNALAERDKLVRMATEARKYASEISLIKGQVEVMDRQLAELNARKLEVQAEAANTTPIDVTPLVDKLNDLDRRIAVSNQLRYELSVKIAQAETELAARQREVEQGILQQEAKAKALTDQAETKELQSFLRKNRARFSSDIWDGLLHYASSLISNASGGVLRNISRAANGNFTVEENGKLVPVEESSGAQRSMMGLALRIAMTMVFYGNKSFLLLDEVTADMSDENAAMMQGMLSSLDMQIVTVTHSRYGDAAVSGTVVEIGGAK